MKGFLLSLVLVAGLAAVAFGAAAALEVKADTLQAGATATLACQSAPVTVKWSIDYSDASLPYGTITAITIGNLSGSCDHLTVDAVVRGGGEGSQTALGTGSGAITMDSSGSYQLAVRPSGGHSYIDPSQVSTVTLVFHG